MATQTADRLHPDPIERISMQIARIGSIVCRELGHKLTAEDLMCRPVPVSRQGPSVDELERKVVGWGRRMVRRQEGRNGT